MKIETILAPAELPGLAKRDLSTAACVVFDILRATSTFVTALHHGATTIIPVSEISEALELKKQRPGALLGGERHGMKIRAEGIDFDLGNSPREYTPEKVKGQTIVSTTTNGTIALRASGGARLVLAGSFLNLSATAKVLREKKFENILLVCAGTGTRPAQEDVLAAGALAQMLRENTPAELTDSTQIALAAYEKAEGDWARAASQSENARRLLGIPELREDVAFCLRRDVFDLAASLKAGRIKIWEPQMPD